VVHVSDADAGSPDAAAGAGGPDPAADTGRDRFPIPTSELDRYLQFGGLALAVVFAAMAAFGLYDSAHRVVDVWVTEPYQPVFTAGLNLVVLLLALGVVSVLVGRLSK
jgi:hypothetical protein